MNYVRFFIISSKRKSFKNSKRSDANVVIDDNVKGKVKSKSVALNAG